jgi:peptidyl-prolyl cis-trans isomerase D
MTTSDRSRRNRWLAWSAGAVVLALVLLCVFVPWKTLFRTLTSRLDVRRPSSDNDVARIEGESITVAEFRLAYQRQIQALRAGYANMSEQMLKQLGIDEQVLQQMVEERAEMVEARRRGFTVNNDEVARFISSLAAFQENGRFIGESRYREILGLQRPPIAPGEFEEGVRRTLLREKLRSTVTGEIAVTDDDVRQQFHRQHDTVKLEVVLIPSDQARSHVQASDADVAAYFDVHRADYRIGERRKVRYVLVDTGAMRSRVTVSPLDVERFYNGNIETYFTPEIVRASHILLKTEGKDDATVKARAGALLKRAKGGADFAELARKNSEDEASARNGGDLDYFARGRMVPEFDEVAFSLEPGRTSDVVKTQYGYHIIKVVARKPSVTRPIEEVRQQIVERLTNERARAKADELAEQMAKEILKPADLDRVAQSHGLEARDSGYVTHGDLIGAIGHGSNEVFALKEGEVTGVRTTDGRVFMVMAGREAPRQADLVDVKERVREDLFRQKAFEIAQQKAQQLVRDARGRELRNVARAAGLEATTTGFIPRGSPIPGIGVSEQVDEAAFALPAGAAQPIRTENGLAAVRVVEKRNATPEEFAAAKDKTREDLLSQRRDTLFATYMTKARQGMTITVNREVVKRAIGG